MAYDIFYFDHTGRRMPEMDRDVGEYDTPRRNKMLRSFREYAEAIQTDHPHRLAHYWDGQQWVEGRFVAPPKRVGC